MVCTFERTIFQDKSNGYCVIQYKTEDDSVPRDARKKSDDKDVIRFTAFGYGLPDSDTIDYDISGNWEKGRYGLQLRVETYSEVTPKDEAGICGYLSSGLIKGLGEKMAERIVKKFGMETLDIIENEPERLLEVSGISEAKLEKIIESYKETTSLRELITFLSPYDVSVAKISKIKALFGENSMETIKTDPFQLCSIKGFGFKTVDAIARKVSYTLNDEKRIMCAFSYLLSKSASEEGHLFVHQAVLRERAHVLLNEGFRPDVVSEMDVYNALCKSLTDKRLISDNQNIYLPYYWYAERDTARAICDLMQHKTDYGININTELSISQRELNIELSPAQVRAVRMCFESNFSIITGGPGTGKTTVLKTILNIYKRNAPDKEILLTAPTGIAARRMADSTGHPTAMTMHSALEIMGEDDELGLFCTKELEEDLIIADEVSMMDMVLAKEFFTHIKSDAHVILVGDPDQLPSVGPGKVLKELIGTGIIPVTCLDTVFRQAENSRIALNAQKVNAGKTDLLYGSDFEFIGAETEDDTLEHIRKLYSKEVESGGIDSVQILSPKRTKFITGTEALNVEIQNLINPPNPAKPEITFGKKVFRLNDKVIQTKNAGNVSNGDIGYIRSIYQNEEGDPVIDIDFSGDRTVSYGREEFPMLDLAYALTIHKSQGSEFMTIIVPMLKRFYGMLQKNLIYTGITRAKKKVIIIGQRAAMFMAIHASKVDDRNSLLGERIKRLCNEALEKEAV